ncbi:hypothetical protein [Burkholderia sp. Ac-20353]|uniref:hypothetical protein n=1 Tax=Burkholderia sp. Ac-20353 TaxID=2703894 RepID=UPI00197C5558|nr:hypothetical protein [Burkholderia sp. Ac-20353]MBN3789871.1 hypothetical protein [Burkholderia sp. Ac-20353]
MTTTAVVMLAHGGAVHAHRARERERTGRDANGCARADHERRTQRHQAREHAARQRPAWRRACASNCTSAADTGMAAHVQYRTVATGARTRRDAMQGGGDTKRQGRIAGVTVIVDRRRQVGQHREDASCARHART